MYAISCSAGILWVRLLTPVATNLTLPIPTYPIDVRWSIATRNVVKATLKLPPISSSILNPNIPTVIKPLDPKRVSIPFCPFFAIMFPYSLKIHSVQNFPYWTHFRRVETSNERANWQQLPLFHLWYKFECNFSDRQQSWENGNDLTQRPIMWTGRFRMHATNSLAFISVMTMKISTRKEEREVGPQRCAAMPPPVFGLYINLILLSIFYFQAHEGWMTLIPRVHGVLGQVEIWNNLRTVTFIYMLFLHVLLFMKRKSNLRTQVPLSWLRYTVSSNKKEGSYLQALTCTYSY